MQASMEMPGIKGLWSLQPSSSCNFDKYLVQSYAFETRILSIDNEELSEFSISGFESQVPTLFCGNMDHNVIMQVTASRINIVDCGSLELITSVTTPNIIVADGNRKQVITA